MFKDGKNQWLTRGLFYELSDYKLTDFVQFTLGDEDLIKKGKTLTSLKSLYIKAGDPTEYQFAIQHLGGWSHWKRMLDCKDIKVRVEEWREELEIKIRSEAIFQMNDHALAGSYQASKYLADRGWDLRKAGAPSKAEKAGQKKVDKKLAAVINADAHRLGIGKNG